MRMCLLFSKFLSGALLAAVTVTPALAQDTTSTAAMPEKVVFVFQKQKNPQDVKASADKVASFLQEKTGVEVEVLVPSNYGASVQAVVSNKAQIAYVSALPYLLARAEAPVKMIVAEERDGRTDYDSIFVVSKDSPIKSLEDLKGKRMVFTSPTSTSGYVFPYARLIQEGLLTPGQDPKEFFSNISFGGGYDRALLAVANGQADVCAVSDYTMEGQKADVYLKREDRDKLRVLAETPGVPTHGIMIRSDLPQAFQDKMQNALLELSSTHPELLADVYGASKLVKADDSHVAAAAKAIEDTKLKVQDVAK
jgi:phosphonate transport system substrate-binding protein